MTTDIAENIAKLRQRIGAAEKKYGRSPGSVRLVAVSKTRPPEEVAAAIACGLQDFGESYVQEALPKIEALEAAPCWHFIGPLQSNKCAQVATSFDWVHSVDREKIARRLAAQRPDERGPLDICLQVNISGESSKSGATLETVEALTTSIAGLPQLRLRGLMGIPAPDTDFERQRRAFATLREALERLGRDHPGLDTLSMGMSADLEAAIAEGATMVRVGTAIFGPRRGTVPSRP